MLHNKFETIIEYIKDELKSAILKQTDFISTYHLDIKNLKVEVDKTKNIKFADYSSNIVMLFGLDIKRAEEFAQLIINSIKSSYFEKIEFIKPGFINFTIKHDINFGIINEILEEKDDFGKFRDSKLFYNIEFVSANPTGLLHIGHARNAAIGDTLARIWEANGIKVNREYYINDAGNQIDKLALSVLIRYKELFGETITLPEDSYHGEEIIDVAKIIKQKHNDKFLYIKVIDKKDLDGKKEDIEYIKNFSKDYLLKIIKETLIKFGVKMDIWFSESSINANNLIPQTLRILEKHTYKKDGALWLRTTEFGDDKDRVLIKSDGVQTYFMPDIAYHDIKLSRGYDKIFNIWGSDHKSYADRMGMAIQILGFPKDKLHILIMQMVKLVKNGEEFKMSKRSGNSITLDDLINAIGKDPARWYMISQSIDTHLEIDVDKALSKNNDNPYYYVQYAHARINQILKKAQIIKPEAFDKLTNIAERELINQLQYFKPTINNISHNYEVNKIVLYLLNLAKVFHSYYASNKVINDTDPLLTAQRYYLVKAIKQVLRNGLSLIGIDAVNEM